MSVTANQISSQLLKNGKPGRKIKRDKIIRDKNNECHIFHHVFQMNEIITSLQEMKNRKEPGYEKIVIEQIKYFGLEARQYGYFNN